MSNVARALSDPELWEAMNAAPAGTTCHDSRLDIVFTKAEDGLWYRPGDSNGHHPMDISFGGDSDD